MMTCFKTSLGIVLAIGFTYIGRANSDVLSYLRHESSDFEATYTSTSQYVSNMLASVNAQRTSNGLSALCISTKLMVASMRHSTDMAANNFIGHTGSDGSTMAMRITATGYKWTRVAENVAAGQVNVTTVMNSWMNSAGHRANILGDYTMFSIAYAYNSSSTYKHYWTQDFAKGSTEKCSCETVAYVEDTLSIPKSTMNLTENSTVVLPNER